MYCGSQSALVDWLLCLLLKYNTVCADWCKGILTGRLAAKPELRGVNSFCSDFRLLFTICAFCKQEAGKMVITSARFKLHSGGKSNLSILRRHLFTN